VSVDCDTHHPREPISSLDDSLARLRDFPDDARSEAGYHLNEVQLGNDPDDWKPIKTHGPGVREIRVREASGALRVIYLATLPDRVRGQHAFHGKPPQTGQKDIQLAVRRLRDSRRRHCGNRSAANTSSRIAMNIECRQKGDPATSMAKPRAGGRCPFSGTASAGDGPGTAGSLSAAIPAPKQTKPA